MFESILRNGTEVRLLNVFKTILDDIAVLSPPAKDVRN